MPEEGWRRHKLPGGEHRLKMENDEPDDTVEENQIFDIIFRKINQLPEVQRYLREHGSTYVGLNVALRGLIANRLCQCILNVTQAHADVITFLTANMFKRFCIFSIEYR